MAFNKVILAGNITRDPELRVTQGGKSVCSFTIAVKRRFQDVTDFHDCVAWDKTAESISKYFYKGKEILVEGELQKRSYEKDGQKRWVSEVRVENFAFMGRKEDVSFSEIEEDDDDLPFGF